MGEIILSSDDEDQVTMKRNDGKVRWDRFMRKKALKVLLVEADDSTRQIIAALLRKCSYKVLAVADGLKAWEIINGRPDDVDLILTEVDLPSISGFALLTLITEHDACKHIPVIMMSSFDSVSLVYKCMLRGAADFLMKPIRRNELTNLWQHVWRRQSAPVGEHVENVAQGKVEATSENNPASNNTSGSLSIHTKNKDRSDTQNSCTKPHDFAAESPYVEIVQDLPQAKRRKSCASHTNTREDDEELETTTRSQDMETTQCDDFEREKQLTDHDKSTSDNNLLINNDSSREAIDLIGSFDDNRLKSNVGKVRSNDGVNNSDCSPHLDLSLKRFHPSATENQGSNENQLLDEKHNLNHSNSSPFARYHTITNSTSSQQKENGTTTDSDKNIYNSDSSCPTHVTPKSVLSTATNQSEEAENTDPGHHQHTMFPNNPVPVKGVTFDRTCTTYGSVLAHIFSAQQSGPSPNYNPISAGHKLNNYEQYHKNQGMKKHEENNMDCVEGGRGSPTDDCSANSSFCNGNGVKNNGAERINEGVLIPDINSHRSNQREAALVKFRLKRKERCYEKKVRYESRKKLAEQRPRVKGQFVRQANTDPSNAETDS